MHMEAGFSASCTIRRNLKRLTLYGGVLFILEINYGSKLKQTANACVCYSVPEMLRVFEHESEQLITSLEEIRDKFDPDSPFWKVS